jgi:hypothetical protein
MSLFQDDGYLIPAQRSLEDIRSFSIRNLYSPFHPPSSVALLSLPDTFFTVSVLRQHASSSVDENENYIPVYQSELVRHSLNPTWLPLEWATNARFPREQQRSDYEYLLAQSRIILRVYSRTDSRMSEMTTSDAGYTDGKINSTSHIPYGEYFPLKFDINTECDVLVSELEIDLRDPRSLCFLGFDVTKVLAATTRRAVSAASAPGLNTTINARRAHERDAQGDTDLAISGDAAAYNLDALPLNSLIISLKDGHYVPSETHKQIHRSTFQASPSVSQSVLGGSVALVSSSTIASSTSSSEEYFEKHDLRRAFDAINRLMQLRRDSLAAEAERASALHDVAAELGYKLQTTADMDETLITSQETIERLKRVFELRKARDTLLRSADRAEISVLSEKARLARSSLCVKESAEKMQAVSRLLEPMQAELSLRHDAVLSVQGLVTAKQLSLLSELRSLYPIQEQEKGKRYSIRGIVLPHESAFASAPEEQVSTALGYTCHLISLVSKYLQVPLRYLPQHFVSRSSIKDEILMHTKEWPLYLKGVDRDQIRVGFRMLQRNVKQILSSQGIAFVENGHILLNLNLLFISLLDVPVPDSL